MRDATKEELDATNAYIESISEDTGFNFYDAFIDNGFEPVEEDLFLDTYDKVNYGNKLHLENSIIYNIDIGDTVYDEKNDRFGKVINIIDPGKKLEVKFTDEAVTDKCKYKDLKLLRPCGLNNLIFKTKKCVVCKHNPSDRCMSCNKYHSNFEVGGKIDNIYNSDIRRLDDMSKELKENNNANNANEMSDYDRGVNDVLRFNEWWDNYRHCMDISDLFGKYDPQLHYVKDETWTFRGLVKDIGIKNCLKAIELTNINLYDEIILKDENEYCIVSDINIHNNTFTCMNKDHKVYIYNFGKEFVKTGRNFSYEMENVLSKLGDEEK